MALIGGLMPKFSFSTVATRLAASLLLGLALSGVVAAQTKGAMGTDPETVAQVRAWNAECLQCHVGDSLHEQGKGLFNLPKTAEKSDRISPKFAASNHGNMACRTCHVGAFKAYPHTVEELASKAETLQCNECHAQESFRVEAQVAKSVHSKNLKDNFTCSTCHDPHIVASAKKLGSVHKLVAQDNAMCMECHNSDKKFAEFGGKVLPDKKRPDIDKIHEWLPNTQRHWQAARCIDCHTPPVKANSSLSVSHEILNKDKAQKNCSTCHAQDSALRTGLYRHIKETEAKEMGFANAAFLRNSYVVGATRNIYLDLLGLIMVGGTIGGVSLHGLLRILAARRRKS